MRHKKREEAKFWRRMRWMIGIFLVAALAGFVGAVSALVDGWLYGWDSVHPTQVDVLAAVGSSAMALAIFFWALASSMVQMEMMEWQGKLMTWQTKNEAMWRGKGP